VKIGTLVQRSHFDGREWLPYFGVVTREMPRTFEVTWERGLKSRVRKVRPNGVMRVQPYNIDTAREILASKGVSVPTRQDHSRDGAPAPRNTEEAP
jgi:hypothetical protein